MDVKEAEYRIAETPVAVIETSDVESDTYDSDTS